MKYVKVPILGYGIVLTICTLRSMERKELYEVMISNYPSCSCPNFKFMKARTYPKRKWMPCKHLYFVLQEHCCISLVQRKMFLFIALVGLLTK